MSYEAALHQRGRASPLLVLAPRAPCGSWHQRRLPFCTLSNSDAAPRRDGSRVASIITPECHLTLAVPIVECHACRHNHAHNIDAFFHSTHARGVATNQTPTNRASRIMDVDDGNHWRVQANHPAADYMNTTVLHLAWRESSADCH